MPVGYFRSNVRLPLESPAKVVNVFVDKLDAMKIVEDPIYFWQVLEDNCRVGGENITGRCLDLGFTLAQTSEELHQSGLTMPLGHPKDLPSVQIDNTREKPALAPDVNPSNT